MGADSSRGQNVASREERRRVLDGCVRSGRDRTSIDQRPAQDRHELPGTVPVGAYHEYFHRNRYGSEERPLRTGDGRDLDWLSTDQWLAYDVAVPERGTYRLTLRVAAESDFGGGDVGVVLDEDPLTRVTFAPTGGWYAWDRIGADVELPAGHHTLRLVVFDGGWKLREMTVE